jgi:hypothetical protein
MALIVIYGLRVDMKYGVNNNGSLTFQRAVPMPYEAAIRRGLSQCLCLVVPVFIS